MLRISLPCDIARRDTSGTRGYFFICLIFSIGANTPQTLVKNYANVDFANAKTRARAANF